eukprot:jgi/Bigna1/86588/estExt_fgenesh1_pg.C_120022
MHTVHDAYMAKHHRSNPNRKVQGSSEDISPSNRNDDDPPSMPKFKPKIAYPQDSLYLTTEPTNYGHRKIHSQSSMSSMATRSQQFSSHSGLDSNPKIKNQNLVSSAARLLHEDESDPSIAYIMKDKESKLSNLQDYENNRWERKRKPCVAATGSHRITRALKSDTETSKVYLQSMSEPMRRRKSSSRMQANARKERLRRIRPEHHTESVDLRRPPPVSVDPQYDYRDERIEDPDSRVEHPQYETSTFSKKSNRNSYKLSEAYNSEKRRRMKESPQSASSKRFQYYTGPRLTFETRQFLKNFNREEEERHNKIQRKSRNADYLADLKLEEKLVLWIDGKLPNTMSAILVAASIGFLCFQIFTERNGGTMELINFVIFFIFLAEFMLRVAIYRWRLFLAIPVSMPFVYFVYYDLCALERISIYTRCTRYQGHRPVLIRSSLITAMSIGTFIVLLALVVAPSVHMIYFWLFPHFMPPASALQSVKLVVLKKVARCVLGRSEANFQNLTSNIRDFIQMLLAYVPASDETSIDFREKAIRLQIAAFIMFTQAIRGERDLKLLTYQGLLTLKERKKLKTVAGCYYLAYSWIRSDLWLFARRHADRFVHPESTALCIQGLEKSISSQQSNIENMFALIETPVPYIYTHLVAIISKIELVLASIWISEFLRYGIDEDSVESIILGYIIIVGLSIIVEGILEVHSSLSTPFGYTAVDFPLHLYVRSAVALVDDTIQKIHPYGKPKLGTETKLQDGGSGSRLRRNDQDTGSGSRLRRNDQDMGSGSKCRRTLGQDVADGGSGSKTNKSSVSKNGFYEVKHSKASSVSKIGGYETKDLKEREDTLKMSGFSGLGRRGSF